MRHAHAGQLVSHGLQLGVVLLCGRLVLRGDDVLVDGNEVLPNDLHHAATLGTADVHLNSPFPSRKAGHSTATAEAAVVTLLVEEYWGDCFF